MEAVVILDEAEESTIAKEHRDVDCKEGDGDPVMSSLQTREASQQKGGSANIGPHSMFAGGEQVYRSYEPRNRMFSVCTTSLWEHITAVPVIIVLRIINWYIHGFTTFFFFPRRAVEISRL